MLQSRFFRSIVALSLALGLVTAASQVRADALSTERETTLSEPVALAPSIDENEAFLPESKRETMAQVAVAEIAPKIKKQVLPNYPKFAQNGRIQGVVFARVLVDENGKVAQVGRIEGQKVFHQAVKTAAKKWEFTPAMQGELAVRSWVTVPFSFEM